MDGWNPTLGNIFVGLTRPVIRRGLTGYPLPHPFTYQNVLNVIKVLKITLDRNNVWIFGKEGTEIISSTTHNAVVFFWWSIETTASEKKPPPHRASFLPPATGIYQLHKFCQLHKFFAFWAYRANSMAP